MQRNLTRRHVLALGASLVSAPAVTRAQNRRVKITMGGLNVLSDIAIFMAMRNGYFAEEGLDIETVTFKAGPQIVPPLASNQLQISGLSTSPALFNAIGRGIGIKIVADKGRVSREFDWAALVLRPDVAEKVGTISDLKGLKIAVPAKGVSTYTQLLHALELGGLKPDQIEVVDLGFPDMFLALSNKAIDGAMLVEPFVALAVSRKVATRWKGVAEFMPFEAQNGIIAYSEQFIREQPEAAQRWMVAYLRGVRSYMDAIRSSAGKNAVFQVVSEYTELKNRELFDQTRGIGFDRGARVEERSIAFDQKWFLQLGLQQAYCDLSNAIDYQYVSFASAQLLERGQK